METVKNARTSSCLHRTTRARAPTTRSWEPQHREHRHRTHAPPGETEHRHRNHARIPAPGEARAHPIFSLLAHTIMQQMERIRAVGTMAKLAHGNQEILSVTRLRSALVSLAMQTTRSAKVYQPQIVTKYNTPGRKVQKMSTTMNSMHRQKDMIVPRCVAAR